MRHIDEIVIHCSATKEGDRFTFEDCMNYHINFKGWSTIGYHYYIEIDGAVHKGRDIERIGAHVYGHNKHSVGICYEGGLDLSGQPKDTRTEGQKASILDCIREIQYLLARNNQSPKVHIKGHRDYPGVTKACPCFDAISEYAWINA